MFELCGPLRRFFKNFQKAVYASSRPPTRHTPSPILSDAFFLTRGGDRAAFLAQATPPAETRGCTVEESQPMFTRTSTTVVILHRNEVRTKHALKLHALCASVCRCYTHRDVSDPLPGVVCSGHPTHARTATRSVAACGPCRASPHAACTPACACRCADRAAARLRRRPGALSVRALHAVVIV